MEQKESKTTKHFWFSMIKSTFRFGACFLLYKQNFGGAAIFLAIGEFLGVVEEF